MKAMVLPELCQLHRDSKPLKLVELSRPRPGSGEVLIEVKVCGVCHTELDEIEGRTPPDFFPVILGHQVVGEVCDLGPGAVKFSIGDRVGVAWIFSACGNCEYCNSGLENLCPEFQATGRDANGGYAEFMIAPEPFIYPIPADLSDSQAAPLLCAGAIGYRSLKLTGLVNGQTLGLTGFGASAHLVLKMVQHQFPDSRVLVFARSEKQQRFALELGAAWAGNTDHHPPQLLDAIIDTTPAWMPIVEALRSLKSGGRLVVNAIRKEVQDQDQLMKLDYGTHLWMEKEIKSVANITRKDVNEFLQLAGKIPLKPTVEEYLIEETNQALLSLKFGSGKGAKVLRITD